MSKPREEVNNQEYHKDIYFLYEIISQMKNTTEIKNFLKDMMTSSELRMFKRRWHIACALEAEVPMREVARLTKTSTATVLKVSEKMERGKGGLKVALERTKPLRRKNKKLHQGVSATFGSYYYIKND